MNPAVSTSILAHEYMHTIQKSYSVTGGWCGKNNPFAWLSEATAQWAMDYVYPAVDEEQEVANWFFDPRGQVVALEKSNDHHEYGAYLFFFFATHYLGDNDLVRQAWVNSETFDSVACVDQLFLQRATPYLAGAAGLLKGNGELPLGEGATYRFEWDLVPLQEP